MLAEDLGGRGKGFASCGERHASRSNATPRSTGTARHRRLFFSLTVSQATGYLSTGPRRRVEGNKRTSVAVLNDGSLLGVGMDHYLWTRESRQSAWRYWEQHSCCLLSV